MESGTDAIANEGDVDVTPMHAPCTTVATLYVATRLRAWLYRRILLRTIFQFLDGNVRAMVMYHRIELVELENVRTYQVRVTTELGSETGKAHATLTVVGLHKLFDDIAGKHITGKSISSSGEALEDRPVGMTASSIPA